jgi:hypothetical protein
MVPSSRALPAECGMVVQPLRAATECELERAVQKTCLMDGLGPVIPQLSRRAA